MSRAICFILLPWILVDGLLCRTACAQVPAHELAAIRQAASQVTMRATPQKPRTVLIWNTPPTLMDKDPHKGYCIPYGTAGLQAIGEASRAFTPVVSDDLAEITPANLRRFDAIVLNNSSGPWITPTHEDLQKDALRELGSDAAQVEAALRQSFLDFVRRGGGVVSLHFAIAANAHWPEFRELFGASFTGHPWTEEVGVTNEDPQHPLVAAFGGADFRITDEIYEYGPPFDRTRLRVLLSLDPARTNMGVPWINRRDHDFALAWVKSYGEGRVFNTSFGHMASLYSNPQMLQFYLDAIQFATGDLSAPTEPRTERPKRNVPGTQPVPGMEPGFMSLFDGETLSGWQGDPQIWSVREGAITGRTTAETKLTENNFLIWKDEVEDFELRLKFRLESGNSGIYFRARKRAANESQADPLIGMQADFDDSGRWTGVIMEYLLREVLTERGQAVTINETGQKQIAPAPLQDPAELLSRVKKGEWNDYRIRAQGGRITLWINGAMTCQLNDQDPRRIPRGWLALQVHVGPPMIVQFKDIALLRL